MSKFLALKGISTNFTPYSGDIATGLKYNNSVDSSRKQIIKIIQDFISNDSFEHYYYRWYCSENSSFDLEEINKLHNPYGWMTKVIKELVLLAPMIGKDGFTTTVKKKQDVLYSALDQMNWNILNEEIDETCETKGDFFSYWYYEQDNFFRDGWKEIITTDGIVWENPIPRVKVLESENMKDITYDSNYNVTGYVYEQDMVNERINDSNGQVTYEMYKVTMIFKKGFIKVIDPVNYPEKGYKIFLNKEWEKDIIRVIHVPSFKKQRDKFSYIPAIDYLDSILLLDDKTTILSMINKYHGFPVNWTVDLRIDWDNSSVMPGGVVRSYTEYDPECNTNTHEWKHKGDLITTEISNQLETLRFEINEIKKNLYKIACLIREELEEILGKTDSSRVISQLRLPLENKYEKRSLKKADAFKPYFKSTLISTGNYSKRDEKNNLEVTFEMPDVFINTSAFDDIVLTKSKMLIGKTSIDEEMDKDRMTQEDKENRRYNLQNEGVGGNEDVTITNVEKNAVQNGQNSNVKVDNQLKQKE